MEKFAQMFEKTSSPIDLFWRICELVKNQIQVAAAFVWCGCTKLQEKSFSRSGQGTTEYAILVGVLVVTAIVAITLFSPKIEELWNSIAVGINGL